MKSYNQMDYATGEWVDQPEDDNVEMATFECKMHDDALGWVCGFIGVMPYQNTRFVHGFMKTAQCPNCDNEMQLND